MHTIFLSEIPESASTIRVEGEEARHATRVKRLAEGDRVRVLDARGKMLICTIAAASRSLELRVEERHVVPRLVPALHLFAATPKGPRLDKMIDQLSQIGVASWTPLVTDLGVVDPGEHKLERTHRIAIESAKQCARAWTLDIQPAASVVEACRAGGDTIIADADAPAYQSTGHPELRLLIGPEGGFTTREREAARAAGARFASFGPHIMRIETAAVAAAAIILNAERPHHPAYASALDPGHTEGD